LKRLPDAEHAGETYARNAGALSIAELRKVLEERRLGGETLDLMLRRPGFTFADLRKLCPDLAGETAKTAPMAKF
jgi:hypothetical protein